MKLNLINILQNFNMHVDIQIGFFFKNNTTFNYFMYIFFVLM